VKEDPFGVEFAEVNLGPNHLTAHGVAIASDPISYRLDYTLETAAEFVTSCLHVVSRGEGWRRAIELERDDRGSWKLGVEEEGRSICRRRAAIQQRLPALWTATSAFRPSPI
jgi:hypothetical protein